jgi:hypothetical protein
MLWKIKGVKVRRHQLKISLGIILEFGSAQDFANGQGIVAYQSRARNDTDHAGAAHGHADPISPMTAQHNHEQAVAEDPKGALIRRRHRRKHHGWRLNDWCEQRDPDQLLVPRVESRPTPRAPRTTQSPARRSRFFSGVFDSCKRRQDESQAIPGRGTAPPGPKRPGEKQAGFA